MIFVAVGTQKFSLNRLLKQIDELIQTGKIKEEVFAQIGHSDYKPQNYKYKDFIGKEEFDKVVEQCDVLITHSGVGTIISGLNRNKPIILYPRLAKYKEHVDDHQLEIAQSFFDKNFVLLCNENDDLSELVEKSKVHKFDKYKSQRENVVSNIIDFLDKI